MCSTRYGVAGSTMHEICEPALAHVAAFGHTEQIGRRVTRAVDQQFHADLTARDQVEQGQHRMLHQRQAGGCLEVAGWPFRCAVCGA